MSNERLTLESTKRAVDIVIEQDEQTAIEWLESVSNMAYN